MENSPKCHHKFQLNDAETGVKFTDVIEINTLELGKIPKQDEQNESTATINTQDKPSTPTEAKYSKRKYDWLRFLKAEREEEFDMLAERSPVIKQAVVELKRLSQSEEAQRLYDARQKAIWDENSRMRTAKNKGHNEALIEVAINMIKRGTPLQHIVEDTGLSVAEVEKLK